MAREVRHIKFSDYLRDILKNDIEAKYYINAALEDFLVDHDKELFLRAIKQVIQARGGVAKIAQQTNINRQHLYKMLSANGNPSFDHIISLLSALNFTLKVDTKGRAA